MRTNTDDTLLHQGRADIRRPTKKPVVEPPSASSSKISIRQLRGNGQWQGPEPSAGSA